MNVMEIMPSKHRRALEALDSIIARYSDHGPVGHAAGRFVRTHGNHLREFIADITQTVASQQKMLADCFKMAGADCDGNEDFRIAPRALQAVTDLRRDYDDGCRENRRAPEPASFGGFRFVIDPRMPANEYRVIDAKGRVLGALVGVDEPGSAPEPAGREDDAWKAGMFDRWNDYAKELGYTGMCDALSAIPELRRLSRREP